MQNDNINFYNYTYPEDEGYDVIDYSVVLYFSPNIVYEDTLKIYAMGEDYIFSKNHGLSFIEDNCILSENLPVTFDYIESNNNTKGFGVISPDNVTFINTNKISNKKINSFVICSSIEPVLELYNLEDLPFNVIGKNIKINFSKGINKLFRYNSSGFTVGSMLISNETNIDNFTSYENKNIRSSKSVSREELVDKSLNIGKSGIYKDISISGKAHPLTGDLVSLQGNAAIAQSLKNILLANAYERPFSSQQIAGNLHSFLFEFNDDITHMELKTGISVAINNHEPRVTIIDILVSSIPESYSVEVQLIYSIKTTNKIQTFSIMLERA